MERARLYIYILTLLLTSKPVGFVFTGDVEVGCSQVFIFNTVLARI
jgi:hypothetical protein